MGSFADSFLRVITSITILFRKSLTLKPGAIRYQEKYWHIIHQMKSLKENWIISIKQLKCSIYYCNLRCKLLFKILGFSFSIFIEVIINIIHNSFTGMSITVWVLCVSHFIIYFLIFQKLNHFIMNFIYFCTN